MCLVVASASSLVSPIPHMTPSLIGLEFDDDDFREVKRAKKLPAFDCADGEGIPKGIKAPFAVAKLEAGGMHTVALATNGAVFTWGCNDEGALGREGNGDKPLPVAFPSAEQRITGISCGDSHSTFYNVDESVAFLTGLYRVSINRV